MRQYRVLERKTGKSLGTVMAPKQGRAMIRAQGSQSDYVILRLGSKNSKIASKQATRV